LAALCPRFLILLCAYMSSPFSKYRSVKQYASDSGSDSEELLRASTPKNTRRNPPAGERVDLMDPEQLRGVVQAAIDNALAGQAAANLQKEREFRQVIDALTSQVAELRTAPTTSRSSAPTPEIKVYAAIEIRDTVQCSEPLFRGGKPPPLPTTYLDDTMVVHAIIRQ